MPGRAHVRRPVSRIHCNCDVFGEHDHPWQQRADDIVDPGPNFAPEHRVFLFRQALIHCYQVTVWQKKAVPGHIYGETDVTVQQRQHGHDNGQGKKQSTSAAEQMGL